MEHSPGSPIVCAGRREWLSLADLLLPGPSLKLGGN